MIVVVLWDDEMGVGKRRKMGRGVEGDGFSKGVVRCLFSLGGDAKA